MIITKLRHQWPEKAGFCISRPNGHPQYTFLHFATQVEIRVGDSVRTVPPGSCILYAPGVPQWFYAPEPLIHNWFHAGEELGALLEEFSIPVNTLFYLPDTAFICELFGNMERELFSQEPYREALTESYLRTFLALFSRAIRDVRAEPRLDRQTMQVLRQLRQEVLSQPEKKWTIAQMAELSAFSTSRLHSLYKRMFGTSPMRDLIEARVDYAKILLGNREHLSLPQIAARLGYNDQYHFIRQFKAVTGMTPGAYRRSL